MWRIAAPLLYFGDLAPEISTFSTTTSSPVNNHTSRSATR
jgi:hypothetical protein